MAAEQIELGMAVPVCAWCRPEAEAYGTEQDEVSHGICPRHLKKLKAQILGSPSFTAVARAARKRAAVGEALLPLRY